MRGIYTIVMRLERDTDCRVGALGSYHFERGIYLYTGSARGRGAASIEGRKERHLGKRNRNFWHIDYVLALRGCKILAFVHSEVARDLECTVNRRIQESSHATFPVKGLGSSDCSCASHLLHLVTYETDEALAKTTTAYNKLGLRPRTCRLD